MLQGLLVFVLIVIGGILIFIMKELEKIDKHLERLDYRQDSDENSEEESFHSKIEQASIADEEQISPESMQRLKKEILELLKKPDNWDGRAALPIEDSAAKRAIRFLLLMDRYSCLSEYNMPSVGGTVSGGVLLSFCRYGNCFEIESRPDEKFSHYHYRRWWVDDSDTKIDFNPTDEGESDDPKGVIYELIDSGAL